MSFAVPGFGTEAGVMGHGLPPRFAYPISPPGQALSVRSRPPEGLELAILRRALLLFAAVWAVLIVRIARQRDDGDDDRDLRHGIRR